MAEFNDSLLQFDSILLDTNENQTNPQNHLFSDIDELNKTASKTDIDPCDFTSSETLSSQTTPNNNIEIPEIIDKFDVLPLNKNNDDTECNVTFSEILHQSTQIFSDSLNKTASKTEIDPCDFTSSETLRSQTTPNNNIEMPEITDKLDVLPLNKNKDDTECNETFSEILHQSTQIFSDSSAITNEIHTDQLDVLSLNAVENNSASDRNSDSGIHDSENNIIEDSNVIDILGGDLNLSNNCGVMISDFTNEGNDVPAKDEEFHDAVQFFKDPSSFTFLENAGSTTATTEPLMTRSSLYVNFDPLHAKFYAQSIKSNELLGIAEDEVEPEMFSDNIHSDSIPVVLNKHLANISPRESLGNILISFDSPVSSKDNSQSVENNKPSEPPKLYTEEELQQALKIQELTVQETFLKNQHDLEMTRSQKQQELETKLQEQHRLSKVHHCLLKEILDLVIIISDKEKVLHEKLEVAEKENDKLKEDLKTSVEDLQSVESTFSDFHKRYEQCKTMLKMYTQNEGNLKQQLENMKVQLTEKEEMYKVLQTRTEEMLDKANTEVANVKKAGDAQVAVLKAQLQKAELKISSLESDVKHVKIENGKLSSICDELMAKVSEG